MTADDRAFWVATGWHAVVAGFVIYLGIVGAIPVTDALLAVAAVAGLALPSTVGVGRTTTTVVSQAPITATPSA